MIDESVLTMQQRQKRAMNMRRNKEKLRRARERAKTRQAPETKRPTEEGRRGGPHLAGVIGLETPGHGLTHMAVLRSGGGRNLPSLQNGPSGSAPTPRAPGFHLSAYSYPLSDTNHAKVSYFAFSRCGVSTRCSWVG